VLDFSDDQASVMAAKAERIAQSDIDLCLASLARDIVHPKVTALILVIEVNGRGDDRFVNGFYTYYKLNSTACPK